MNVKIKRFQDHEETQKSNQAEGERAGVLVRLNLDASHRLVHHSTV